MSEVVNRILRAAGEAGRPVIHAVVLARDSDSANGLVERLTAMGCRAVAVADEPSAAALLRGSTEFNALLVDGPRSREELKGLFTRMSAGRAENAYLALINLADQASAVTAAAGAAESLLIQSVGAEDLPAALEAVNQSYLLASGEVQRQVEIIARAVIKLGQRLRSITASEEPAAPTTERKLEISDEALAAISDDEAIAALDAGKHVSLQKPPTRTLAELDAIAAVFIGGAALRHFLVRHEVGDPLAKIGETAAFGLEQLADRLGIDFAQGLAASPMSSTGLRAARKVAGDVGAEVGAAREAEREGGEGMQAVHGHHP